MSAYKEAIELYVQALKKTPEGISPLSLLGSALLQTRQTGHAVEVLSLAVQDIEDAFTYRLLGNAQEAAGSNDAALASYKKSRELNKKDFDTHAAMGMLYQKMNRPSEAVQAYNAALTIRPDAGEILLSKAECFMSLNDVENARKLYRTLRNLGNNGLARKLTETYPIVGEGPVDDEADATQPTVQSPPKAPEASAPTSPPSGAAGAAPLGESSRSDASSRSDVMAQLKEYKEKLKSSPYDPEIYFEMGMLLNQAERPKDAVQAFSLALKFDSSHAAAKYEKGLALHVLGRTAEARALSQQLHDAGQEKLSEMLRAHLGMVGAAPIADEAAPLVNVPLQSDDQPTVHVQPQADAPPEVPDEESVSLPLKPEPLVAPLSKDEIIASAKDALKTNPFDSATYLKMGKAYHALGKHRDALTAYNLAIRFTPKLAEAKYHKALLLIDQNKPDDARALYESMKDMASAEMASDLVARLGISGSNGEQLSAAETANRAPGQEDSTAASPVNVPPAIPAETPPPPPLNEPALQPPDKEAELEESKEEIKQNPYDPKAYLRLGLAYEHMGRYADALKGFNLAQQFSPDLSLATYHKGLCYLRMGDQEQALQEYTRLREEGHTELAQKLNDAFNNNGDEKPQEDAAPAQNGPPPKYGVDGDPESIIEACKKVIKQDPYDPEAYHRMGKAYKDSEKYQEAINAFGLAVKANGTFYEADFERGLCHLKLGEEEKALQVYTALLKDGQKDLAKQLFDLFLKRLK